MATLIQRTGFLGQNDTSIFWASSKNTGCLFLPYISMVRPSSGSTHFKEKLALRFPKRTYAKSPVVDAQISNILALLQKIENKYSVTSKKVLVEDAGISAATVLSREISLGRRKLKLC
ncbi:hypothetical protein KY290_021564 [Solanum tuberosum]|uniref:Uncharacterized protein n=1 Tax=Solanum tuberosum TaxID=4113 RepID=A0ABQ7V209_SOLTU|nr:hypothetical protein KY289_020724 [Solanum tuberosum]KAH0758071.1 hypothetical protein KY290_021564 [Solanum tuberosum]